MKRILQTSAIALMLSTPAFADAHMGKYATTAAAEEVLGSEFIGARVYVVEKDLDQDYVYQTDAETEWDDIGEINDIVMTRDGEVKSIVIGVGGFIGIGEKDVAVDASQLRFVQDGDDPSDYFVVFTSSKQELEAAPEWEDADRRVAAQRMREQREKMRADIADMDNKPARGMMQLGDVKRDGYVIVTATDLTKDDLIGARVYDVNDEDIGEISELVAAKGGGEQQAIVDVGGLLGIGEKPVAIPVTDMRIMREADGDDVRVYVSATEESMENMPEYKK